MFLVKSASKTKLNNAFLKYLQKHHMQYLRGFLTGRNYVFKESSFETILYNLFIGKLIFIFSSDNNANYREEDCNACVL